MATDNIAARPQALNGGCDLRRSNSLRDVQMGIPSHNELVQQVSRSGPNMINQWKTRCPQAAVQDTVSPEPCAELLQHAICHHTSQPWQQSRVCTTILQRCIFDQQPGCTAVAAAAWCRDFESSY